MRFSEQVDRLRAACASVSMPDKKVGGMQKPSRARAATALIGLAAAAIGIGNAVISTGLGVISITGFLLASSSLVALIGMSRVKSDLEPFLGNIAIWVALGAYVANQRPVEGAAFACAAIGAAIWAKRNIAGVAIVEIVDEENIAVEKAKSECAISLSADGYVISGGILGEWSLSAGEKILERIHVGDRVAFLRSMSAINMENSEAESVSMLVNIAALGKPARFDGMELVLCGDGERNVRMELAEELVPENPVQANDPMQTNVLAIVSHELRTPLNAIIGFSDLLQSEVGKKLSDDSRLEYAGLINDAGNHLLALVNTILDVSKIESGSYTIHRDEFCFNKAVAESVAMVREQAKKKNIQINERLMDNLEPVLADRRAVKQILINLLTNAVKYTEEGGFITIDATQKDDILRFEISDTGIGMSDADLAEIGKPFIQVDSSLNRNGEGSGLGLSLVKGLVGLHGGELNIQSQPNIGTRVMVSIPATDLPSQSGRVDSKLVKLSSLLPRSMDFENNSHNKEINPNERKIG